MRVLVLGSTGIIGFGISKLFASQGWTVYGLTKTPSKVKFLEENEITAVVSGAQDFSKWESYANSADVIIDAVADYQDYSTPGIIQKHLLEILKKDPSKKIIYTSGVWVYGNQKNVDERSPLDPIKIVEWRPSFEKVYLDAGAIVVRPGCVFGKSGSLTATWFNQLSAGNGTFPGTGNNSTWSFVHVDDLAEVYYKISLSGNSFNGQVFNAASYSSSVLLQLQEVAKVVGFKGEIKFQPPTNPFEEALALNQSVSNNKSKELLGWVPKQSPFHEDVKKYYNAFLASQK